MILWIVSLPLSPANERMPVLMAFSDIHAVIDMKCFQVLQTDQMIEMLKHPSSR